MSVGVSLMRSESLLISQIPHVSRLYQDYLTDFSQVLRYYGAPPLSREWQDRSRNDYPAERRQRVAQILQRQNEGFGASPKTMANIERLRAGAHVVVTGQQVSLFGGPLFAMLKALTAIKLAEEANAVPVFWLATQDHDLAEVAFANIPAGSHLQKVSILPNAVEGAPVGSIPLDEEIATAAKTAEALLGESEVSGWLRECYRPGATLGEAYARLFAKLFADEGLVILDPADAELQRIAQPLYLDSAVRSEEINHALLARGNELEAKGYHAQVKVSNTSTLLFTLENSSRTPVQRVNSGFAIGGKKVSAAELRQRIEQSPQDFSGNALFRPVVQDYLLPTLAYVGGPAEVAYFAQSAVVYEKLLGAVTPIVPRVSATLIEPRVARKLEKYRLVPAMAFQSEEVLRRTMATHVLPAELTAKFQSAKESLERSLASLDDSLSKLDPTLREAGGRAGKKMRYQLTRLEQRAALSETRRNEEIVRHAHEIASALYPHKSLQEREVAGVYFVARYGSGLITGLKEQIQPRSAEHQVLYL